MLVVVVTSVSSVTSVSMVVLCASHHFSEFYSLSITFHTTKYSAMYTVMALTELVLALQLILVVQADYDGPIPTENVKMDLRQQATRE